MIKQAQKRSRFGQFIIYSRLSNDIEPVWSSFFKKKKAHSIMPYPEKPGYDSSVFSANDSLN